MAFAAPAALRPMTGGGLSVGKKALSDNGLINKIYERTLLIITYTKIGMPNT